ncbi:hypothetical protein RAA17_12545 [Komagataeibacter rhaeticus]|nr:hypothetical protein [Komagataeibacter rhaeticus]
MVAHLKRLGITTIELLPIQCYLPERHLLERGLTNYWGYNTLAFSCRMRAILPAVRPTNCVPPSAACTKPGSRW